jgi:hypothetical protein
MKATRRFAARAAVVLVVAVGAAGLMLATGASATTINTDVTPDFAVHSTYDLTNSWTIKKSVDQPTLTLSPGHSATVTYSVAVTNTQTASNLHILDALIATSQVNPFNVNGAQIDVTPSGSTTPVATIILTCPNFGPTIAPGQQWNCNSNPNVLDWDATVPTLGSYTVTGTLHLADGSDAVRSKIADFTPAGGLLPGQPRVFGPTSVEATDSYAGDLGTVAAPNSQTFTYQRTIAAPAGSCSDFTVDNTATLTDNATGSVLGTSGAGVSVHVANCTSPLTPGYWKNHMKASYLPLLLGNFSVSTTTIAANVFSGMNCSASQPQGAVGCLTGHELAAKLNLENHATECPAIDSAISSADAFLIAVGYVGPTGTYTLSATDRAQAVSLAGTLDSYNNGKLCP